MGRFCFSTHSVRSWRIETPSAPSPSAAATAAWIGFNSMLRIISLIGPIEAGPLDPFNHSFSIMVECETQAEIDRLWERLAEGGATEQCGWLRDRWGLCWQIAPAGLAAMMKDPDRAKAERIAKAMLQMVKLDIVELKAAAAG